MYIIINFKTLKDMKTIKILEFNVLGENVILKNVPFMVHRDNKTVTIHFVHSIFDKDLEIIQLLKLYCLKTNNGFLDDKENDKFCFHLPISCITNVTF